METPFSKSMSLALKIVLATLIRAFTLGWPIMWMWNYVMPELFDLSELSFWQAASLFVLSRMLFGRFGPMTVTSKPE